MLLYIYVILGILLYFLVTGITAAFLGRELPDDAELLAVFFSAIWPVSLPIYILGKVFQFGRNLIEKPLNRDDSLLIPGTDRETTDKIVESYRKLTSDEIH